MSKKTIIISISVLLIALLAVGVSYAVWRIDTINAEIAAQSGEWNESANDMVFEPINDAATGAAVAYKLVGYNGKMTNLSIPKLYQNLPVTTIGSDFKRIGSMVTLIVPDTVIEIENNALMGCYSLQRVTFCEGLIDIGDNVLMGCNSLTYVKLPSTVTNIGSAALSQCAKLSIIDIGATESAVTVGVNAFRGNNVVSGSCAVNYGTGV